MPLEVLEPAFSYDLLDLDIVKDELKIDPSDTTSDAWLARAITQVSQLAQDYIKRPFARETIRETRYIPQDPYPYQTPGGLAPLQLERWPVASVSSVLQIIAAGTTQTLTAGQDYAVDFDLGQLIRLNPFTGVATKWEALPVIVEYDGGYDDIPADVVDATLRLVVNRWFSRGRDPLLLESVQPGLGTQRWWVGGPKGGGTLPAEVQGMLDIYRAPTVA